uniref:BY PROTMAP: gi/342319235/gb/EGU11185.1/ putative Chloride channel protein k [Rhodotorula glutinis ATCC 204091] n=1 Tax=Rhodotorula toruloides TaxID=5286 RepID=A0A0K3CID8_RHOTO
MTCKREREKERASSVVVVVGCVILSPPQPKLAVREQSAKFSIHGIAGSTFALAHRRTSAAEPARRVLSPVLVAERSGHVSVELSHRNGPATPPSLCLILISFPSNQATGLDRRRLRRRSLAHTRTRLGRTSSTAEKDAGAGEAASGGGFLPDPPAGDFAGGGGFLPEDETGGGGFLPEDSGAELGGGFLPEPPGDTNMQPTGGDTGDGFLLDDFANEGGFLPLPPPPLADSGDSMAVDYSASTSAGGGGGGFLPDPPAEFSSGGEPKPAAADDGENDVPKLRRQPARRSTRANPLPEDEDVSAKDFGAALDALPDDSDSSLSEAATDSEDDVGGSAKKKGKSPGKGKKSRRGRRGHPDDITAEDVAAAQDTFDLFFEESPQSVLPKRERAIGLMELQRACRVLKEKMTDGDLNEMLEYAARSKGLVDLESFARILVETGL